MFSAPPHRAVNEDSGSWRGLSTDHRAEVSLQILASAFSLQSEPEKGHSDELPALASFGLEVTLGLGAGSRVPPLSGVLISSTLAQTCMAQVRSPPFPASTLLLTSAVTRSAKDSRSVLGLVLPSSKSPKKECREDNRGHVPSVCQTQHWRFLREE